MPTLSTPDWAVDYLEAGQRPTVLLLHSSVSGNRQWRTLMSALSDRYHVIAPNLIGYGQTGPWPGGRLQTLADQSALVRPFLAQHDGPATVIGHSFGATVAMRVALDHPGQVTRLVLLEPNLSQLLRDDHRDAAFREAYAIRNLVKEHGGRGDWERVAAAFADY